MVHRVGHDHSGRSGGVGPLRGRISRPDQWSGSVFWISVLDRRAQVMWSAGLTYAAAGTDGRGILITRGGGNDRRSDHGSRNIACHGGSSTETDTIGTHLRAPEDGGYVPASGPGAALATLSGLTTHGPLTGWAYLWRRMLNPGVAWSKASGTRHVNRSNVRGLRVSTARPVNGIGNKHSKTHSCARGYAHFMLRTERHERILEHVSAKGGLDVNELSRLLNVSGATVRRDLQHLVS